MHTSPEQYLRYHILLESYKSSVQIAAQKYEVNISFIYKLRKRWKMEGLSGLLSQSKAPKNPYRKVTARIETLKKRDC